MDSLFGAEILKTRKRWMPYVIFIVILIALAFQMFPAGYLSWTEAQEFDIQGKGNGLRTFALPWSIPTLLDSGQFWGSIFIAILTSSVVATEHSWGTVRQALARGQSRSSYLTVKLCGIIIISAALLLGGLFAGILLSLVLTAIAGEPVTLDVPDGPSVPEIGLMVFRAGLGIVPYGLMAFSLSVVARSTTLGLTGVLLFLFGEAIVTAILENIGGVAADLRDFSIGDNAASLLAANRIGPGDYNSLAPREHPVAADLPDVWVALVVLALYCLAFLAIAYYVFQRRDLRA